MEYFKKGQMIPKRLGLVDVHRKARHAVTFGSDVFCDINGNIIVLAGTGQSLINVKGWRLGIRRNNGTFQKKDGANSIIAYAKSVELRGEDETYH